MLLLLQLQLLLQLLLLLLGGGGGLVVDVLLVRGLVGEDEVEQFQRFWGQHTSA